MPLLYAQVKMADCRSHIEHYVVDIPSLSNLISFCTNDYEVGHILATPGYTLLTYSPIYDNAISGKHFREDVEFLEEEVYRGYPTQGIARWLLRIMDHTHCLSPSPLGANMPKYDDEECRHGTFGIVSSVIERRFHFEAMVKKQKELLSTKLEIGDSKNVKSFLFRNIFMRIPRTLQKKGNELLIYERLESHIGETPEDAKLLAVESGLTEATLDTSYYFKRYNVFFVGIESFTLLPVVHNLPIKLASQDRSWPWEFDLAAYKVELLDETVRANRVRKQMNLPPFWT